MKNDNRIISKTIDIDEDINSINLASKSNAFTYAQSFVIPGLGQLTSGRTAFGVIYLSAFAGAATWYYLNYKNYNDTNTELDNKIAEYNNTSDFSKKVSLASEISTLQTDVENKYDIAKTSMWIVAGVYAVNVLDVLIGTPVKKEIVLSRKNKISLFPTFTPNAYCGVNVGIMVKF